MKDRAQAFGVCQCGAAGDLIKPAALTLIRRIGGGEDMDSLKTQAVSLGIDSKVIFLGSQSNPFAYMNLMDAFISTSRYEGQGMNILEAMVVGLPIYCTSNLEKYIDGLKGYDNIVDALVGAMKKEKNPQNLAEYNGKIIAAVEDLANSGK